MGRHVHVTFEIPFKGQIQTRKISLFKDGNKLTGEGLEVELRNLIGEPEIKIVDFTTFPENYNFKLNT
jgi:hypothetical protein